MSFAMPKQGRVLPYFPALLGVVLALSQAAGAGFSYNGFSSPAGLILQGDAGVLQDRVRLTPSVRSKVGGLWYATKQPVQNGFETVIRFQVTEPTGFGADGLAFVVRNDGTPRLGFGGGNIGFGGITNAVAVKFDNYHYGRQDGRSVYVKYDEIAVVAGPSPRDVLNAYKPNRGATVTNGIAFADGKIHTAKIAYSPGRLCVYIDDLQTPVLSADVELSKVMNLDAGRAWVGFTAATGADSQNHDLLAWSFVSSGGTSPLETNIVTIIGQAPAIQHHPPGPGVSASAQPANVGTVTALQSPQTGDNSAGQRRTTLNAGTISVLGTWETTIAGADKGLMILTFKSDFTFSGYGLRTGLTNLFTISGDWQYDVSGRLTGQWWEKLGNVDTMHGTFTSEAMPGRGFTVKAAGTDSPKYSWTVAPATDYVDLSGHWKADIGGVYASKGLHLQLSSNKGGIEAYPGVFEITGDGSGKLIISSENQVCGYLKRTSGIEATFTGSFSPAKPTLQFEGVYDNGLTFSASVVRE